MEIAYAAYTESATFMLDAKGVCLWVVPSPSRSGTGEMWRSKEAADRCVGAQYVASVDATVAGGLVELPRIGTPLIFASVDSSGRVSLLRSGPLLKFEAKTRSRSGVHSRPNVRTPIAETGNPYEDEVATVKVRPHHLQVAASSVHQARVSSAEASSGAASGDRVTPSVHAIPTRKMLPSSYPPPPASERVRVVPPPTGRLSLPPPSRRVPSPFPHTQRSPFGIPGPAVRAIPIPKSAVND